MYRIEQDPIVIHHIFYNVHPRMIKRATFIEAIIQSDMDPSDMFPKYKSAIIHFDKELQKLKDKEHIHIDLEYMPFTVYGNTITFYEYIK